MNIFLTTSVVIVFLFLVFLIAGFLRKKKLTSDGSREQNIFLAKEKLREIEAAKLIGTLSEKEFLQAKTDIEIALAQDLSTSQIETRYLSDNKLRKTTIIGIFMFVPLIVVGLYLQIGSPAYVSISGPGQTNKSKNVAKVQSVQELVKELAERLESKPDNPQGWAMLGRTYMQIQQYENAVYAFERLNKILPNNPPAMLSLADALSMRNGGKISQRAFDLINKVLKINPTSVTALWLAGNAYSERKQNEKAIELWRKAIPLLSDEPGLQRELNQRISGLEDAKNQAPEMPKKLEISVEIGENILPQLQPNFTLFIYARSASGPKIPLAVQKFKLSELSFPVITYLTDSDAMMPKMNLSSSVNLTVGARISKSGQAIAQSDDLMSREINIKNDHKKTIRLTINQRVSEK